MAITGSHKGMPIVIGDFEDEAIGYFEAAAQHKLVVKRCKSCGILRWFPTPGCFWCNSGEWEWHEVSGKGTIHTFEIVTHAIQPAFADWAPYPVVIVELDEQRGVPIPDHVLLRRYGLPNPDIALRHIANLLSEDMKPEKEENVAIGARVEVVFYESQGITMPMWKLSKDQPPANQLWHYVCR